MSPPSSQVQKPNSFLFRASSHSNVRPTGTHTPTQSQKCCDSNCIDVLSGSAYALRESGRSESCMALRSPKEERPEITQLRKVNRKRGCFFLAKRRLCEILPIYLKVISIYNSSMLLLMCVLDDYFGIIACVLVT